MNFNIFLKQSDDSALEKRTEVPELWILTTHQLHGVTSGRKLQRCRACLIIIHNSYKVLFFNPSWTHCAVQTSYHKKHINIHFSKQNLNYHYHLSNNTHAHNDMCTPVSTHTTINQIFQTPPIWIWLFTHPTRASFSCLDLSCSLPPPFPYPYASIYIQLPHTDTPSFRFYRKAWANKKVFSCGLNWDSVGTFLRAAGREFQRECLRQASDYTKAGAQPSWGHAEEKIDVFCSSKLK